MSSQESSTAAVVPRGTTGPTKGNPSSRARDDTSPGATATDQEKERLCHWCGKSIEGKSSLATTCSQPCRQSIWRARKRAGVLGVNNGPLNFIYADPPYPGFAHLYKNHPDYGGEVDHKKLIDAVEAERKAGKIAGWALSTSSKTLKQILPLCPDNHRVCAWTKPGGVSSKTYGLHSKWEPVIVVGGRPLRPGIPDWVMAQPARLGGQTLVGRKPDTFNQTLFKWLGMLPGDILYDLFPGTGAVSTSFKAVGGIHGDRIWDPATEQIRGDV